MTNTQRLRYLELIAIAKSDVMTASEFDELLGLQKLIKRQVALVTSYQVALVCSLIQCAILFQIMYRTYLENIQILYKLENIKIFRFLCEGNTLCNRIQEFFQGYQNPSSNSSLKIA